MEASNMLVLFRASNTVHILVITDCLKVATYEQHVHFIVIALLGFRDRFINIIQFAMAASFNGNLVGVQSSVNRR